MTKTTPPQQKKRHHFWLWFIVAAYAVIIFGWVFPQNYDNQSYPFVAFAWLAFMVKTFQFHIGLILVAVTCAFLLQRRWRLLSSTLVLALISLAPILVRAKPETPTTAKTPTFTVMSVNLLINNPDKHLLLRQIRTDKPDILLLQECSDEWLEFLRSELTAEFPHFIRATHRDPYLVAVFSRRPFVEEPTLVYPENLGIRPVIRAVLNIEGRNIAFYNFHPQPPESPWRYRKYSAEFAVLLHELSAEKLPIIVAGDFNASYDSPSDAELRHLGLTDTHLLAGDGRGATWHFFTHQRWLPGIRTDHIYISNQFTCAESRIGEDFGSDHLPVVAKISFTK